MEIGPTPGTTIGGYRLLERIGAGGMGSVYLAEDKRLRRRVAVKLLRPGLGDDERFRERFERESVLAAALDHPNILPVYEANAADDGTFYIAMRFVDGSDLRELLRREGRLEPARACAIVTQVALGLDAAHEHGLVHRDVKPGNILVATHAGRDHAYVSDFGVARHLDTSSATTGTEVTGVTVDYVAPERISGQHPTDGSSDGYSLACVAYECLVGEPPFRRDEPAATLWAHVRADPPPPSSVDPALPRAVDGVFARELAKRPDARYPTCTEFADALTAAVAGEAQPVAHPRRRLVLGVGGACLIAGAAAIALVASQQGGSGTSSAMFWGAPRAVASIPDEKAAPYDVATGDLNHDGRPDVVLAHRGDRPVPLTIFINKGQGAPFASGRRLVRGPMPSTLGAAHVMLADLNGDRRPDVVVASERRGLTLLETQAGHLVDVSKTALPSAYRPGRAEPDTRSIAIADVNSDGAPDLLVDNVPHAGRPGPQLLINDGKGGFAVGSPLQAHGTYTTAAFARIATSEAPADGSPDIVLLPGPGTSDPELLLAGNGGYAQQANVIPPRPAALGPEWWSSAVSAVDLNGDGLVDLVVSWTRPGGGRYVQVLMHGAGLTFTDDTSKALGSQSTGQRAPITAFYPVDLAGHGPVDLVTHLADGRAGAPIFINKGNGELRTVSDGSLTGLDAPINSAAAGRVDLFDAVAGRQPTLTERAVVLRQRGPGTPPPAPSGVEVTTTRSGGVHVSWPPVYGAHQYIVQRSQGGNSVGKTFTSVGSSLDDTTTIPGRAYYYSVVAVNNAGDSAASAQVRGSRRSA
jgi:serine/threonine-protein kinase